MNTAVLQKEATQCTHLGLKKSYPAITAGSQKEVVHNVQTLTERSHTYIWVENKRDDFNYVHTRVEIVAVYLMVERVGE